MTKEDLLNEMYTLVKKFDRDLLQLMNMLRENGELNDEISVTECKFDHKNVFGVASTFEPMIGEVYTGKVTDIKEFGCYVEYAPGRVGMVHISKISAHRLDKIEDAGIEIGSVVNVKYLGLDRKGRMDFSIKDAT